MKHFLNFKPTIVYRKGSSFMLKTSLAILYAVPVVMAIFWGCNYYETSRIKEFYTEAEAQLAARTSEFKKNLDQFKTLKQDLEEEEKSYFEYQRVSTLCQTSWSTLLNRLESLTPGQGFKIKVGQKADRDAHQGFSSNNPRRQQYTPFFTKFTCAFVLANAQQRMRRLRKVFMLAEVSFVGLNVKQKAILIATKGRK